MSDQSDGNFSEAAARLVEAAWSAQVGDCETAKAHIARALALIHDHPVPGGAGGSLARGGLPKWQARRLAAHIDANLAGRIPIEDLAMIAGFSGSHLCRVFKCTFGVPPHTYITRRRIEFSQHLMLTTSDTISEIALRCGMSDQSHFTRAFRRIVGETPHSWRRNRHSVAKVKLLAQG